MGRALTTNTIWTREQAESALGDYVDGVQQELRMVNDLDFSRTRVASILSAYKDEYIAVHMATYQKARESIPEKEQARGGDG